VGKEWTAELSEQNRGKGSGQLNERRSHLDPFRGAWINGSERIPVGDCVG
jgi:hypothetical protein